MNPKKKNIEEFLETYVPSPSSEDMEADGARVLRRLKSERRNAPSGNSSSPASRAWWQPVAAAVLIAIVGIGLYAAQRSGFLPAIFPVQRESSPQVVPSAAQSPAPSVKAAAETTQVAGITPGSTKPGTAPSREEILRGVAAQIAAAQSADVGAARPKFAAASVRPVPVSPLIVDGFRCLGVDGLLGQPPGRQYPTARQGRCTGQAVHLIYPVYHAYTSSSLFIPAPLYAIDGLPPSLNGSYFAIEAVADNPERVTKGELKLMLQTLLEDRFKARVHLETRAIDGYVLTIAKSGIKFKETSGDATCKSSPRPLGVNGKCKMETLTMRLQLTLDGRASVDYVPIADKTGLTGIYDINFALEEIPFGPAVGTRGAGGGAPPPRQFTTPLPKALEDQLGLHLERGKVPVEFVVVDHIEQPTAN